MSRESGTNWPCEYLHSADSRQTEELAETLGRTISMGSLTFPMLIVLDGPLGAGKTHFVRGFVRGIDPAYADWVSSPTYALCNVYPSDPPIHHVDAYRLSGDDDLESIGYWDFVEDGPTIMEWPSRVPWAADTAELIVRLMHGDAPEARQLGLLPRSKRASSWVSRLLDVHRPEP